MRRRHRRWLVVVGCALVVAVLAFGALVRGSHERARTQVLAEIGEPLTRPPRAIRPGVQSRPCRSGHRMATALAASEPLLDSERDLVVEFLAEPRPEAMEAVRAVVEPRAEALHSLLDAADCAGHGPVPRQPGDLLDLLDMGRLAAAHAALLALHGDAHGAMRWALDTWALSHQFGEGRLEELTVSLVLSDEAVATAERLVSTGQLPPIRLVPALEVMRHLLEHRPDLGFTVLLDARESSREVVLALDARPLLVRPGVRAHLAYAREVHRALQLPYPRHRPLIAELDAEQPWHPTATLLRPSLGDLVDHDALAHSREAALVVLAGLRVWRDVRGGCPPTLAALVPDFLPAVPADPIAAGPFRYDPETCEIGSEATLAGQRTSSRLVEPGGTR